MNSEIREIRNASILEAPKIASYISSYIEPYIMYIM